MTFPLKSSKSSRTDDSSSQLAKDLKNLDDNGILEAEADDNENKLMEKANMLGVVENANDVLSEVFKKWVFLMYILGRATAQFIIQKKENKIVFLSFFAHFVFFFNDLSCRDC